METVEIKCPRSIDLKNLVNDNNPDTKSILQSVDIFDKVNLIKKNRGNLGVCIESEDEFNIDFKNKIRNIIETFSRYVNINIDNLTIGFEKESISLLSNNYNILAGVLIGLNILYSTNLSSRELIFLASFVDSEISYYLVCGYKRIDINNKIHSIGENKFNKYYLIDDMSKEELIKIKEFLLKDNIDYGVNGNYYFIALKDRDTLHIPISLKKEFKGIKIIDCKNTDGNRIFVKYLNYFE